MKTTEGYLKQAICEIFDDSCAQMYSPDGRFRYDYMLEYPGILRQVYYKKDKHAKLWKKGVAQIYYDLRRLHDGFEQLLDEGWGMFS